MRGPSRHPIRNGPLRDENADPNGSPCSWTFMTDQFWLPAALRQRRRRACGLLARGAGTFHAIEQTHKSESARAHARACPLVQVGSRRREI